MASRNGTYLNSLGGNSDIVSLVNGMSPGIYNASMLIRNKILSKNIGKYAMYDDTIVPSGGNYIGEGYQNISEMRPTPIGEGGLMGYTHETDLPDTDFLMRNRNIRTANYDFDESEIIKKSLEEVDNMQPWGDKLYGYSDAATQSNSVKFADYTDYMKSMFRYGLSFEKSVQNSINNLMFNGYTPNKTLVNDVVNFIDGHQGTILDLVPVDWSLGDTELGYVGKKMAENQRYLRSGALTDPITPGLSLGFYERVDSSIRKKGNIGNISWSDDTQSSENFIEENDNLDWDGAVDINTMARIYNLGGAPGNGFNRKTYENPYIKISIGKTSVDTVIDDHEDDNQKLVNKTNSGFGYNFYNENDKITSEDSVITITGNDTSVYGSDNTRSSIRYSEKSNLLEKTRQLFKEHKINTLVSRFHTSDDNTDSKRTQSTQTALDSEFGLSHGRNLLKKDRSGSNNGYSNPYCRVWTYHHQYSRVDNLIRPFGEAQKVEDLQKDYNGRPILTQKENSWSSKTVLNKNGFVNIAPMRNAKGEQSVDIKQCMFSIENLAWKDISKQEKKVLEGEEGPLGGRIMWFPPYDLTITENSNPNWTKNDFIGRGEGLYTYSNTERTGNISFTIVADHPSVIDYWMKNHSNGEGFQDKDEAQQDLLRFFAGCSNLDMSEVIIPGATLYPESGDTEDRKATLDPERKPKSKPNPENTFSFALYYPNNLSGKDWFDDPQKLVSYLMYGQHTKNNIIISGTSVYDNNIENTPSESIFSGSCVGYEVKENTRGITSSDMDTMIHDSMEYWESSNILAKEPNSRLVWGYGRDKDTAGQKLKDKRNSNKKNEEAYKDVKSDGLNSKIKDGLTCSFVDFYAAFQLKDKNDIIKEYCNSAKAEDIYKTLMSELQVSKTTGGNHKNTKRKIHFSVKGGASSHGDPGLNNKLATNRKIFLKKWIESIAGKDWEYHDIAEVDIPNVDKIYDPSYTDAKEARNAIAYVWWEDEKIESVVPNVENKVETNSGDTGEKNIRTVVLNSSQLRYKDEYTFFKELSDEEPFLYKNIIDKVKYFDPAFHAITPEGFNSRLAFLHQCTRQGPTVDAGTNKNGYAGNLAFGRPPVCVLRLGDFYNTRILINNLSINYEGGQWDLNPESIGVQPLLAKVNIGFIFQGGSSLGGPVTRLQNAISFNYYANQEVYDDRADSMVYKDGEVDTQSSYIWVPDGNYSGRVITRRERLIPGQKKEAIKADLSFFSSVSLTQNLKAREAKNEIENKDSSAMSAITAAVNSMVDSVHNSCASPSFGSGVTFDNVFETYKEKYSSNLLLDLFKRNCSGSVMNDWLTVSTSKAIADAMNKNPLFRKDMAKNCLDLSNLDEILKEYNPNGTSVFDMGTKLNNDVITAITKPNAQESPRAAAMVIRSVIENSYNGNDTATIVQRIGFLIDYDDEKNEPMYDIIPNTPAEKYGNRIGNEYALSSFGDWMLQFCKKMGFVN